MQIFKKTTNFDFMGKRRFFIVLSIIVVTLSVVAALAIGPKFGIDFVGGTELQVRFKKPVDSGQVRQTLNALGFPGSEVVAFGTKDSEYLIRLQAVSPVSKALAESVEKTFRAKFKDAEVSKFDFSQGGDKLSIRMSKEYPIDQIESTLKNAKLELGSPIETKVKEAEKEAPKEGEADIEDSDKDDKAAAEETSKKCEGVTCTWPYREHQVYEVNLKGVSERVLDGLRNQPFGKNADKMRSEWVGPKVGKQLREAGIWSIVYALIFIMIYIAVRFDLRFAPGAVVALLHDVLITVGVFTLVRFEVTLATIAALLTIVGYSLNDTIVVFDRIRENLTKMKEKKLAAVINVSINQTLSRTILTSLTTLLVVVSILTIGWQTTIRDFAFALLIGVVVGTYSSIFIASPVVVWLDSRFAKKKA
jgi:preprotein translocase subunit SecF